jgi:hypothetical protein
VAGLKQGQAEIMTALITLLQRSSSPPWWPFAQSQAKPGS